MSGTGGERVGAMLSPPHLGELVCEGMRVGWDLNGGASGVWARDLVRRLDGKALVSEKTALALETLSRGLGVDRRGLPLGTGRYTVVPRSCGGCPCQQLMVADRDDRVEVVVPDPPPDPSIPLGSNYREILGSCPAVKFAIREHVLQVQADVVEARAKHIGHLPLRQPDGLLLQAHIQCDLAVRGLIDDDFAAGAGLVGVSHSAGSFPRCGAR